MNAAAVPPRNGEGDQPQAGGGVFGTSRHVITLARKERRSGNLPEVVLWRALKARPGGFKFRRQHPIGPYILDFACLSGCLAIEIDGEAHDRGDRPARDIDRDAHLATLGFRTMRIAARYVLGDLDAVIRAIVLACGERANPSTTGFAGGPPPRAGEVS